MACVVTLSLLFGAVKANAGFIYWSPESGGNGHFYGLTPIGSWTSAEAYAVSLGGHLVTIDDAAENEFIHATFLTGAGASEDFWIGLLSPSGDWTNPATWVWVSGSPSTYRNWRPGQPDLGFDDGEDDRYAALNFLRSGDPRWDNYPNSVFRQPRGIIELEGLSSVPEPTSLILMSIGLAGLAYYTRHRPVMAKR
jgi:hypothetical protein